MYVTVQVHTYMIHTVVLDNRRPLFPLHLLFTPLYFPSLLLFTSVWLPKIYIYMPQLTKKPAHYSVCDSYMWWKERSHIEQLIPSYAENLYDRYSSLVNSFMINNKKLNLYLYAVCKCTCICIAVCDNPVLTITGSHSRPAH